MALQDLLPPQNLSISDLIHGNISIIQVAGDAISTKPEDYVVEKPPDVVTPAAIICIPAPECSIVDSLEDYLQSKHHTDIISIRCAHLSARSSPSLPVDVVSFWKGAAEAEKAQIAWKNAYNYLMEQGWSVMDVVDMLDQVAWSGKVKGFSRNGTVEKVELAGLASAKWLKDDHISMALDVLRLEIEEGMEGVGTTFFQSVWFFKILRGGYAEQEQYTNSRTYQWVRNYGHRMAVGSIQYLGLILHQGSNHWTAAVIDVESSTIQFGDSLGGGIPQEVKTILLWWTMFHTGKEFNISALPIGEQNDSFSCGVFAWNALATYFLPARYKIATSKTVVAHRIDLLRKMLMIHIANKEDQSGEGMVEEDIRCLSVIQSRAGTSPPTTPYESGVDSPDEPAENDAGASNALSPPTAKVCKESSIRRALSIAENAENENELPGLLKWMKKATATEHDLQVARDHENLKATQEDRELQETLAKITKEEQKREGAKIRKQNERARKKEDEIAHGLRSPGGTKRKIKQMELTDTTESSKRFKENSVAELSRPTRAIQARIIAQRRYPQGRKKKNEARPATYHNWFTPFIWAQIEQAVKRAGWRMSATSIVREAQKADPEVFKGLRHSTVEGWIDRSGDRPRWKASVLQRLQRGNLTGHNKGGRQGILVRAALNCAILYLVDGKYQDKYPAVKDAIISVLQLLRNNGAPLTIVTIRGVMLAIITLQKPEILEHKTNDGLTFNLSDDYVRKWVKKNLHWSRRKATKAAQKLPDDWMNQCERSALRKAFVIKEYDIPSALYVNSDQTQVVYAPGDKMTYAEAGSKQVPVVGVEEKRAFTVMVSVSSDGQLLPFQAIYEGKTERVLPSKEATGRRECDELGIQFVPSGTGTYWSNQATMKSFVEDVLVPYFNRQRTCLNLPPSQKALWQIDVFSVHRSEEFRGYMKNNHPDIVLDFVPGGCTSVAQPCDVGIQRPFKHSIRRSYYKRVVNEMILLLGNGKQALLDTRIGPLRDASAQWLLNAYQAVNKPELIQKAFKNCRVDGRGIDLSYSTLTSFAIRERLRNLRNEDLEFWNELTGTNLAQPVINPAANYPEDDITINEDDATFNDDSSIEPSLLDAVLISGLVPEGLTLRKDGSYRCSGGDE
ncbi:hypothetical protein EST38_g7441 [Candolleomyces aberdarensis]|uniref:Ubiquitin-like protease family profile domain-containing protein n=1 Tax=Candolleomyces aberdarensis TaxID=2316362 RepID=A0A4Q2DF90_9AGAR|nr:hypothetical protein EST38_g7441 [Candolleomyces aberdarensis]